MKSLIPQVSFDTSRKCLEIFCLDRWWYCQFSILTSSMKPLPKNPPEKRKKGKRRERERISLLWISRQAGATARNNNPELFLERIPCNTHTYYMYFFLIYCFHLYIHVIIVMRNISRSGKDGVRLILKGWDGTGVHWSLLVMIMKRKKRGKRRRPWEFRE